MLVRTQIEQLASYDVLTDRLIVKSKIRDCVWVHVVSIYLVSLPARAE
jgi:hypothetical protein